MQPFSKDSCNIHVVGRSAVKDLRVTQTSHALITLWTIGGHSQKVPALSPHNVLIKLIDQRMAAAKIANSGGIRTQHTGLNILYTQIIRETCNLNITKTMKGKTRTIEHWLRVVCWHVGICLLCRA